MTERTWSQVRYWLALSVSCGLAMLILPSGLAMGGPRGIVGWTIAAALFVAPVAIWWTKGTRIGSVCQHICLALASLSVVWVVFLNAAL
jgi:hypothetical protein